MRKDRQMIKLEGINSLGTLVIVTLLISILFYPMRSMAWETDTDRPGMNYKSFWIDKDIEFFVAVKQCEDACKNDPQCKAFTYVKPGVQGVHGRCYLKNGVPAPVKDKNCISGVVRPETDTDRCKIYAEMAVQQNQSNIDWGCGYTGNRWSSNYQAHYEWCMNVPKSAADFETAERERLLNECLQPSTSGDLAAHDWCYQLNKTGGTLSFYPVIKNEGETYWKSKKDGTIRVGASVATSIIEKKSTLGTFPHWYLAPKEISIMEGLTLPYHPDNHYGIKHILLLSHPEDTNMANNANSGFGGNFKGLAFENNPNLEVNQYKYYVKDAYWKKSGDVKQLNTHIILKSINVIDEADGNGNAEPYLWPFFFKIDEEMISAQHFFNPKSWTYTPGGEHGNIGGGYDAGQVRMIPAKYGQWKTTLGHNPVYYPKDQVYVGAVVVLLEEDAVPSSDEVVNEYYPEYTNRITKQLQCKFLNSLKEEADKLKDKGDSIADLVMELYKALSNHEKAGELNCAEGKANEPAAQNDGSNGQGFYKFVAEAEKELQDLVTSDLEDPWYLHLLFGISAFVDIDDFLGAKIFIWKWTDLEKDPYQSFLIKWNDNTGSEDGSFNLRVHIRAYPVY